MKSKKSGTEIARLALGITCVVLACLLVLFVTVYSAVPTASYFTAAVLVVALGGLIWLNQRALKEAVRTRSVRYGANAAMTMSLVLAIMVVFSYLNFNHFIRKDLTKNRAHSLSDQTIKILKDLNQDVKLLAFVKTGDRDAMRSTIDNYLYQSKKVSIEWIDPDREPVRTKANNVKKYGTIIVQAGKRDTRIEEVTEDKLTNAFLKVLKDTAVTICFLTGHGERDLTATAGEGYSAVMQDLASQNYEAKSVSLLEDPKVPAFCSALMVLGPKKAFFPKEISSLRDYLDTGGRAFFALDPNVKGDSPTSPEIAELLGDWYVSVPNNIVIDPASKVANVSPTVPLIGIYSKESPITRDFTGQNTSLFALTSTVDVKAGAPSTLTTVWLAKSTAYAFAKSNFAKELASGKIIKDPNKDVQGPNTVMAAVSGTRMGVKKPEKTPRLIVVGTSEFGSNKLIRYGGNSDLFLNAVSWLVGDESLISIRPKDESNDKATLSEIELRYSKLLTMLLLPGSSMFMGILVWRRRKRL